MAGAREPGDLVFQGPGHRPFGEIPGLEDREDPVPGGLGDDRANQGNVVHACSPFR